MIQIRIHKDTKNNTNNIDFKINDIIYSKDNRNGIIEEFIGVIYETKPSYVSLHLVKGNKDYLENLTWVQIGNLIDKKRMSPIVLKDNTSDKDPSMILYENINLGSFFKHDKENMDISLWSFSNNSTLDITPTYTRFFQETVTSSVFVLKDSISKKLLDSDNDLFLHLNYRSNNQFFINLYSSYNIDASTMTPEKTIPIPANTVKTDYFIDFATDIDLNDFFLGLSTNIKDTSVEIYSISLMKMSDIFDENNISVKTGEIVDSPGFWAKNAHFGGDINNPSVVINEEGFSFKQNPIKIDFSDEAKNNDSIIVDTGTNDISIFKIGDGTLEEETEQSYYLNYMSSENNDLTLFSQDKNITSDKKILSVHRNDDMDFYTNVSFASKTDLNDIRIEANDIYNFRDDTDTGTIFLNNKSLDGNLDKFRNTVIGNGKGISMLEVQGGLDKIKINKELYNSFISIKDNSINNYIDNSDDGDIKINFNGFENGITKFRNTIIGNGKGKEEVMINGSEHRVYLKSVLNLETTTSIPDIPSSKLGDIVYYVGTDPITSKQINNIHTRMNDTWRPIGTKVFPVGTTEDEADLQGAKEGDIIIL